MELLKKSEDIDFSTSLATTPPIERPETDPLEHDNPEIDELEDNEPIEQPEISEIERPERDIDEIDQGDVEPEVNNLTNM